MLFYGVQEGQLAGERWQTGLYFRSTQLDIEGARNVFSATMQNIFTVPLPSSIAYVNLMDSGDSIDNSHVYVIDELTDRKVARSNESVGSAPGTAVRTVPARRDSPMVLMWPAVRTRATGRMYLPRVSLSFMVGGDLSLSFASSMRGLVAQGFAVMTANNATLVIRNRRRHTDVPVATFVLAQRVAAVRTRTPDGPGTYIRN